MKAVLLILLIFAFPAFANEESEINRAKIDNTVSSDLLQKYANLDYQQSYQEEVVLFKEIVKAVKSPKYNPDIIKDATKNPGDYTPLILFGLAQTMFERGQIQESMKWFYLAQIRTSFDAKRCPDISARSAEAILIQMNYHLTSEFIKQPIEDISKAVNEAVVLDSKLPYNYDNTWLWYHGSGEPIDNDTPTKKDWQVLAKKNRQEYLSAFLNYKKSIEK